MLIDIKLVIVVVGFGYVGFFLVIEFGKMYKIIGYDFLVEKVDSYKNFFDFFGEVDEDDFCVVMKFFVLIDFFMIKDVDFIIIVVFMLVMVVYVFDFFLLIGLFIIVVWYMKCGVVVVYEFIVYFGVIEEVCIFFLEEYFGLCWKDGFYVGYFFEWVNFGDKERMVMCIVKVVFGDDVVML